MLIYYTDSAIMQPDSECNLHIETNVLTGRYYIEIDEDLSNGIERMQILPIRDFALYTAQQDFKVNVDVNVHPMLYKDSDFNFFNCAQSCGLNAIIMFINSVTDSHVTFQGYSYEFCSDQASTPHHHSDQFYRSIQLDVVFYETPSFNGSAVGSRMSPLTIQNTSFSFYMGSSISSFGTFYDGNGILRVLQFSKKLAYEVAIENVAWCNNSFLMAIQCGSICYTDKALVEMLIKHCT